MKQLFFAGLCMWTALIIEGCPPMAPVVPTGDADAAGLSDNALADIATEARACDLYCQACANLARLGCSEGQSVNCAAAMRQAATSGHFTTSPQSAACIVKAASPVMARACGGVTCP